MRCFLRVHDKLVEECSTDFNEAVASVKEAAGPPDAMRADVDGVVNAFLVGESVWLIVDDKIVKGCIHSVLIS